MFFTSKFKWQSPSLNNMNSKQSLPKTHFKVPILPSIEVSLNQSKNISQTEKQSPINQQEKIIGQNVEEKPITEEKEDTEDQQLLKDPQKLLRKIISIMKEISLLRNGKTNQYVQLNNSLKHYQSLKAEVDYKSTSFRQNECR